MSISTSFVESFKKAMVPRSDAKSGGNLECIAEAVTSAFVAAESSLNHVVASRRRPWISQGTLDLIDQRRIAHVSGNFVLEASLHKNIKKAARADRRKWLEDLAGSNSWASLRKLRRGTKHLQGRLCNQDGIPVSSEERAETFAQYLESIQWAVRPASVVEQPALHSELPVNLERSPSTSSR